MQNNTPNRKVPVLLKLKLYLNKALFWVLFPPALLGTVISIIFLPKSDFTGFLFFRGSCSEINGIVLTAGNTKYMRISDEGANHMYEFTASYNVNKKDYSTLSYSPYQTFKTGDTVIIQYNKSFPHISRIKGMRTKPYSGWTALILLVPIIAVIIIRLGIKDSRKILNLARNGMYSNAVIERLEETNDFYDDDRYYKVHFTFSTPSGEKINTYVTTYVVQSLHPHKTVDIIYNCKSPKEAIFEGFLPDYIKSFLHNYKS